MTIRQMVISVDSSQVLESIKGGQGISISGSFRRDEKFVLDLQKAITGKRTSGISFGTRFSRFFPREESFLQIISYLESY